VPDFQTTIDSVTEDALEKMFFSGILGPGARQDGAEAVTALVDFSGPMRGTLAVSMDAAAALTYTANFLGEPEGDVPQDEVAAVAGEFANVLCGATLGQLSPAGAFLISPPRVVSGDSAAAALDVMTVLRTFEVPEGNLTVGLAVDQENAA